MEFLDTNTEIITLMEILMRQVENPMKALKAMKAEKLLLLSSLSL